MTSKLKKQDTQPAINQHFNTPEPQLDTLVHAGDSKCLTPNDTKRKQSPPSDVKPGKKLHLGSSTSVSPKTSTSTINSKEEDNMSNGVTNPQNIDTPTPDQVAFEDRLIAKFSNLMTEKL